MSTIRQSLRRRIARAASPTMRPQNLVEKIVQNYVAVDSAGAAGAAVEQQRLVRSGDFVSIRPHHVMTHDNTAAVMQKFTKSIGANRFANPRQAVFTLDHDIQNQSQKNLEKYQNIQDFAKKHGVDFYQAGTGIGHQIMIEEGYAFPYTMVVASDSHSNMYGGVGALGTPVVRTDAAAIWATGRTWWQIPPVVQCELQGRLQPGITGKDVIVALCGLFNQDQVLNTAIEFHGEGVRHLSVDDRLAIANMTTEWGALAGVFPVDDTTLAWYHSRLAKLEAFRGKFGMYQNAATVPSLQHVERHPRIFEERLKQLERNLLQPDEGAFYAKHITIDLATIQDPQVSGPNAVKKSQPVSVLAAQNIPIQKAYLVSCTNSRESDLRAAADIFRQHSQRTGVEVRVADGVELYVAAASKNVQSESEKSGDWQVLMDAGAKPLPPGCGPCIGLGVGLLEDGQVGISATNRNFKGRMGSRKAEAYLSSPAVVAASAIQGQICGPAQLLEGASTVAPSAIAHSLKELGGRPSSAEEDGASPDLLPDFPARVRGELVYCPVDNLNTDGIYPGKYTYRDDLTPSEMAGVVMENYDPHFSKTVQPQDVLVSGLNFGSGSSREQAATSLKYAGVQLILAESFSETFKRNSLNNGLVCLEAPELARDLHAWKEMQKDPKQLTYRTGIQVTVHYDRGVVEVQFEGGPTAAPFQTRYHIPALGRIAQELVLEQGLESWVKARANVSQ